MLIDSKSTETQSKARGFGIFLACACGISAGLVYWHGYLLSLAIILVALGMLLIGFALFLPRLLIPFNKAWLKFGDAIHRIVSPLILSVIFFGIITPIGIVMRLFGKEFLQLRQDPTASSYWIDCQGCNQRSQSMRQQF